MNPKVDFYFQKAGKWQESISLLRVIMLDSGLAEELKWGVPCYSSPEGKIALIHVFKDYCALLFFKGVLLDDPHNILVQQTGNVQAARQIRFTSSFEIIDKKPAIQDYVRNAIEVEKSDQKVNFKKTEEYPIPPEFSCKLNTMPDLKASFERLTPGRQRGYLLYFSAPKQSKTRESRVEKFMPVILNGKGLDDK